MQEEFMVEQVSVRRLLIVLLLALAVAVSGCAHKRPKPGAGGGTVGAESGATGAGAGAANAGAVGGTEEEAAGPQAGLLATRVVYFDFDSSETKGTGTDVVAAHAKYLAANGSARVRLEGHTDERGSREYNIGLGERRAQAVRRALLLQGVAEAQLTTVSYGEERPASAGSDEQAYSQNRRVEIVYLK